ncbi:hypothetical protein BG418_08100 [Streptomyces sp. CBMA152]|nr:hypothetical protein [Streptomyces sp. CBMA152]
MLGQGEQTRAVPVSRPRLARRFSFTLTDSTWISRTTARAASIRRQHLLECFQPITQLGHL